MAMRRSQQAAAAASSSPPASEAHPGASKLYHDRYLTQRKLGKGNFGTAWLVTDGRQANSLKVMKQIFVGMLEPGETVDALHEANLLQQMHHPNILAFHDAFIQSQFVCIVTEHCEGGDLGQRIAAVRDKGESFSQTQILTWVVQITLALQYMHARRILHRDLKTRNIFLRHSVVKLGDFGIARVLMGTTEEATTFAGTPYYMSPECLQSNGYNAKSDMWALGCVLYELCCLKHAFDGDNLLGLLYKICEGALPEIPGQYDDQLKSLAASLMQRNPQDRPSAQELLHRPVMARQMQRMQYKMSKHSQRSIEREQERLREVGRRRKKKSSRSGRSDRASASDSDRSEYSREPSTLAVPEQASYESVYEERSLTPQEKLRRRKQDEADRRAEMLKEAARKNREESTKYRRQNAHRSRLHSPGYASSSRHSRNHSGSSQSYSTSDSPFSARSPSPPPQTPPWILEHPDIFPDGVAPDDTYEEHRTHRRTGSNQSALSFQSGTGASPLPRPDSREEASGRRSHSPRYRDRPAAERRDSWSESRDFLNASSSSRRSRPSSSESFYSASNARRPHSTDSSLSAPARDQRPHSGPAASPGSSFNNGNGNGHIERSGSGRRPRAGTSPDEVVDFLHDEAPQRGSHKRAQRRALMRQKSIESVDSLGSSAVSFLDSTASYVEPHQEADDIGDVSSDSEAEHDRQEMQQLLSKALIRETKPEPEVEVHDPDPIRAARMAQLRKQGQKLLGGKFLSVYQYLQTARRRKVKDSVIRQKLQTMVGDCRDCFVVDQLVYMECFAK